MTDAIEPEQPYFNAATARVLQRTPVAQWSNYAIVFDATEGTAKLQTRGDVINWLRANDLPSLAHEATTRRVEPGAILVLVLREPEPPRFRVLFQSRRRQ